MGVYRRKLYRGVRWFYSGQYSGTRYHSKAIYRTKQEAKRAEVDRIKELDEEARTPYKDMKLVEFLNMRLDYIRAKLSNKYYGENQRYFRKLINFVGDIEVSKITKKIINDLLMKEAERFKREGKDNYKVNDMIRCLKATFNYGIKVLDLSIKNPCDGLKYWSVKISLKHIPKDEEIEKVKLLCNEKQRALVDFVDETGARIMESIRLKYEDIDGDLITLWTRKSKNSNLTPRRIPKPECLNGNESTGKVFTEWESYPRFLEGAVKKAGVKTWNWHSLRHRRASIWANSGMTTFEIMMRLGHSNLQTTMRYLQLLGYTRI